jgi:hypothetical protein
MLQWASEEWSRAWHREVMAEHSVAIAGRVYASVFEQRHSLLGGSQTPDKFWPDVLGKEKQWYRFVP